MIPISTYFRKRWRTGKTNKWHQVVGHRESGRLGVVAYCDCGVQEKTFGLNPVIETSPTRPESDLCQAIR